MLNLVKNENMKIYRRIRTWIATGILVALVILVSFIMFNGKDNNANWKQQAQARIDNNEKVLQDAKMNKMNKMQHDQITKDLKIDKYRVEHDIPPVSDTQWGAVLNLANLVALVTIFTVIVAGDSVAGEFSAGTIKLLLIRPVNRTKILLSKYLSSFLFAIFLLLVLLISSVIMNTILYGFDHISLPYLHLNDSGKVVESSLLGQVLQTYGYACVELVMIVTLAFMISTVFRSSSLAIGLSIFVMYAGQLVVVFLSKYEWIKYLLFANMDLTQYTNGVPIRESMTLGFSIVVLVIYFLIFNTLSWLIFNKRDVAA